MAKSSVYKRGGGAVEFNMTPMIDVTFQLIIFFVLAGQIASDALAKMELADPYRSQAVKPAEAEFRVLVNIVSKADVGADVHPYEAAKAYQYVVGNEKRKPYIIAADHNRLKKLVDEIRRVRDLVPQDKLADFYVEIRGDRRLYYEEVDVVLVAAVSAGVDKMNITARLE